MSESPEAQFTLYSSPFSLYSMMVRHTIYLGTTTTGATSPGTIALSFINTRKDHNLSEHYLLRVNPKGQIPALTGNGLDQPLVGSPSISLYLAEEYYPAMLPAGSAAIIKDLLQRVHAVHGPSFSNKNPTAEMMRHSPSPAENILSKTDLSPEYRKALEAKVELCVPSLSVSFKLNTIPWHYADPTFSTGYH